MNISYTIVASLLFLLFDAAALIGQPVFLDTTSDSISLCTNDAGVKLPATNQLYLGEGHHGASSCSVHLSQSTKVKIDCGTQVQYEVRIILFDTSAEYILRPLTTISADSLSEAEINFDTEFSPEFEIMQHGIPYTSGCFRYHRIKWIVMDECGETAELEKLIDVFDCSKPTFVLSDDLFHVVASPGGYFTINIDTLIKSWLDDCATSDELVVSLLPNRVLTDTSYYACLELNWGVEIEKPFWIADKGNDLDCNGIIEWEERHKYQDSFIVVFLDNGVIHCGDILYVSGEIHTPQLQPVEKAEVQLTSPGLIFPTYVTVEDGKYQIEIVHEGLDYELSCERNDNHKNGVSTLDLVRIQKHLLGKELFTSPYDLIAADANNSQNVSAIDLIELRKLILNIYSELPANKSWRFIPAGYDFENPQDPYLFPDKILISNFESSIENLDFIAVKIGDVNNTVQPNATKLNTRNELPPLIWRTPKQYYNVNSIIEIPVFATDLNLQGFQFTLSHPDLEFVNVISGQLDIAEDAFAMFNDQMTFSWFTPDPIQINREEPLFSIVARARKNGRVSEDLKISSDITQAELYDADLNVFEPQLTIMSENQEEVNAVHVYPNPWKDELHFSFVMVNDGVVDFKLLDAVGRAVYSMTGEVATGKNTITIDKNMVSTTGLLFYKLSTKGFLATGVVVKPD